MLGLSLGETEALADDEGDAEADGLSEAETELDADADGLVDAETELEALAEGLCEALGETDADGEADALGDWLDVTSGK